MPEIIYCEQNTPEWHAARLGVPTASNVATIMAKGSGGGASKTRRAYMYKLAGEIITGEPAESFSNAHIERGHEHEPVARVNYQIITGNTVEEVGFVKTGTFGASPDGFVGDDGLIEIKSKAPHLMVEIIATGKRPVEHDKQCHAQMLATWRAWVDLVIYCPGFPLLIFRITRDEDVIAEMTAEIDKFNSELADVVAAVRAYGKGSTS